MAKTISLEDLRKIRGLPPVEVKQPSMESPAELLSVMKKAIDILEQDISSGKRRRSEEEAARKNDEKKRKEEVEALHRSTVESSKKELTAAAERARREAEVLAQDKIAAMISQAREEASALVAMGLQKQALMLEGAADKLAEVRPKAELLETKASWERIDVVAKRDPLGKITKLVLTGDGAWKRIHVSFRWDHLKRVSGMTMERVE